MALTLIRTLRPADWPVYRDLRLRALADSPAAFGSTHAEESQRPDDAWAARLAAPALGDYLQGWPFAAVVEGQPAGLAWVKLDGAGATTASVYQVWVAPEARDRAAPRRDRGRRSRRAAVPPHGLRRRRRARADGRPGYLRTGDVA